MSKQVTQRVVFQPATARGMQSGINQIVNVLRPTLGPCPRRVVIDRGQSNIRPELLDTGAMIARRIIQLPDRDADVGAMLVRGLLWGLYEDAGDGTTTAAVVFQSIYNQGHRYIVSGGNAIALRSFLERGVRIILDELSAMALPLQGRAPLAQLAESVCSDPPLAAMLGEIFDIIGEYGQLELREGRSRELEREYVEGAHWESGVLSRAMLFDEIQLKTQMEEAAIVISDLEIDDPHDLVPLLEMVIRAEVRRLVIVASSVSERAIAVLLAPQNRDAFQAIAVKIPGLGSDEQAATLVDIAILTGGRPLLQAAGSTLTAVTLADLGRARRVWADPFYVGIVGGKGDPRQRRQHIGALRAAYRRAEETDVRTACQRRIGRLTGGIATLWVGGDSAMEIEVRKVLAERTATVLRRALDEGIVPGGGAALLMCRAALEHAITVSRVADERVAYRMLINALEEPIRTIIANAGYDSACAMNEISEAGLGYGFDVRTGRVVDMMASGIVDAVAVQRSALHRAITGAAQALTIDVLIHPRHPKTALRP